MTDPSVRGRRLTVWHGLPFLAVAWGLLHWSDGFRDPDQFWHVLIGQDILATGRFTGDPAWVFGPSRDGWVTTQWLSEVLMAFGYQVAGWRAGLWATMLLGSVLLLWWGWILLRPGPGLPGRAVVYACLALVGVPSIQERPSLVSFYFVALIALAVARWFRSGTWPAWWMPPVVIVVWAQFHGAWVMVPVTMVLVAAVAWAEDPDRDGKVGLLMRRVLWAVGSSLAAALTPAGVYGLTAVRLFSEASRQHISEWQPTHIDAIEGLGLALLAAIVTAAWARSGDRVRWAEVGFIIAIMGFGFLAFRNTFLAVMLIAPLAAVRVADTWPMSNLRASSTRATAAVVAVCAVIAAAAAVFATSRVAGTDPVAAEVSMTAIRALNEQSGERRVLNTYGHAGLVEALTGDNVAVAIDGRTDRYGGAWINEYVDLLDTRPGWRDTLAELNPTDALLTKRVPLSDALQQQGWRVVVEDEDWLYLVAPTGPVSD